MIQPLNDWNIRGQGWLLLQQNALYGLSATRILVGVAMLGLLLTNFTSRHILWGTGSFWAEPYREVNAFGELVDVFGVESPALFTLMYMALMGLAVAVIIGWRTRATTLLLAIGMAALVERASPMGDQGDNIARIGLLLMVLMNTSAHWSLDADDVDAASSAPPPGSWARSRTCGTPCRCSPGGGPVSSTMCR
ncbi:hypothetical protein BCY76_011925 [Nesterenkonia sp. PF2B19]|nr:hypothetical protein BCY76_011925 [Nesterenkonia sp. PF2B19]